MLESKLERVTQKVSRLILPLLLVAELTLAACGGRISDSRPETPTRKLEPTHRTALLQRFCGLYLNRIDTTSGTGLTLESHILSYNVGDDLKEQFTRNGEQIQTECGTIIFVGPTYYTEEGIRKLGGAGFILPPQDVTQGDTAQN